MIRTEITEHEFRLIAETEFCRANLNEYKKAVAVRFSKFECPAEAFVKLDIFPTWRISRDKKKLVGQYEIPPGAANPISISELASSPQLRNQIGFHIEKNYLRTKRLIVFHCSHCDVYVLKDGAHRLIQCVVREILQTEFTVYEADSSDWSRADTDMRNFCRCETN